jgi:hypothetical protein
MAQAPKDERYRAYWDAIRRRVCDVCLDQRDDGSCRLGRARICALEDHLPALVQAIAEVDSSRMEDYEQVIRAQVCAACRNQETDGSCEVRQAGECALWTYLPLVVDAVEEVRGTLGRPASETGAR